MSKFNVGTRRGTLQNIRYLLDDETLLAENTCRDVELDCTLLAMVLVLDNPEYTERVSKYLHIEELKEDIRHIDKDAILRKLQKGELNEGIRHRSPDTVS